MYDEAVLNIPVFQMRKLKHRDITVLTSYGNTCFLVSVFIYLVNFVGKGKVWINCWEKTQFQFSLLEKKISELLRSSEQCPGCFACSSSFNQKENLSLIRMPLSFRNELPTINLYESKINLKDDYHFEMTGIFHFGQTLI